MAIFFVDNYYNYHYSSLCSLASIYLVVLILFCIFLPFFTSIRSTDKFWKPKQIITDHPIVQFKNEFFTEITLQNIINGDINGDILSHLDRASDNLILSSVIFEPYEYSNENIYNKIKFSGHISKLDADKKITEVKIYFFFNYLMTENCKIEVRTFSKIPTAIAGNGQYIRKIETNGYINLKQNKALKDNYFINRENNEKDEKTFDEEIDEALNAEGGNVDFNLEFKKYYFNVEKVTDAGNGLDIDVTINIPYYQDIILELPNYTNLKNRYVMFSIFFFPTLLVCYSLMKFVIEKQIFKTRIRSELPIKL